MIGVIAYFFMFLSVVLFLGLAVWYAYFKYTHTKRLNDIFHLNDDVILAKVSSKEKERINLKLLQAGLTPKAFIEIILAAIISGSSLIGLTFIMEFKTILNITLIVMGINIIFFMPLLYLEEQIKARVKRIENDLAIFIDLLIIILEGGGGLNNAIDKVTTEGKGVLGKDLLEESITFKNEFITYSSDVAYNNLAKRTKSEAIGTLVGFMRLSEETGIGVKSVFENQSQEIKSAEMLGIEKAAATMNISMTLVMFLFIIPSVIAMIAFPMSAGALMTLIK